MSLLINPDVDYMILTICFNDDPYEFSKKLTVNYVWFSIAIPLLWRDIQVFIEYQSIEKLISLKRALAPAQKIGNESYYCQLDMSWSRAANRRILYRNYLRKFILRCEPHSFWPRQSIRIGQLLIDLGKLLNLRSLQLYNIDDLRIIKGFCNESLEEICIYFEERYEQHFSTCKLTTIISMVVQCCPKLRVIRSSASIPWESLQVIESRNLIISFKMN